MEVYAIGGNPLMLDGKLCKVAAGGQETWVLNENPDVSSEFDYIVNFNSNGTEFTRMILGNHDLYYYKSLGSSSDTYQIQAYWGAYNRWDGQAYRTITFLEPPTGELLTWLQNNGVKQ